MLNAQPCKTTRSMLIVGGITLALVILVLSPLAVAAQPLLLSNPAEFVQPDIPIPLELAGPPLVQAAVITPTPEVIILGTEVITVSAFTDPFLPLESRTSGAPFIRRLEGQSPPSPPDLSPAGIQPAAANVSMSMAVITEKGSNSVVENGDLITYTITIVNNSSDTTANVVEINNDALPANALEAITCLESCNQLITTTVITDIFGGPPQTITRTIGITWSDTTIGPNSTLVKRFRGRVTCQADGATFNNHAYIVTTNLGSSDANQSLEVSVPIELGGTIGLSAKPTWCSSFRDTATGIGGTFSMDWSDFDLDGDLDLALGSALGRAVYANQNGQLSLIPPFGGNTYGVSWADVDGDGYLELIAVGESINNSPATAGTNYIYDYNGSTFGVKTTFTSDRQLFRVAPGNYDNDNDIELVVSTNSFVAPCTVQLFENNGSGTFTPATCISTEASANVNPADFNNDGNLDLAIGLLTSKEIRVFENDGSGSFPTSYLVESSLPWVPYDIAWGDYDGDGYLDIAAAFPLQRFVRVYRNNGGGGTFGTPQVIPTSASIAIAPLDVDWADFDGDGQLELAVVDLPPRIYEYNGSSFVEMASLTAGAISSNARIWSIRGIDFDNDADLDLAFGNQLGPNLLFTTIAPHLNPAISLIPSAPAANTVDWGDYDGDGYLDLLFGYASSGKAELFRNDGQGNFSTNHLFSGIGLFGAAAFGDYDGGGELDVGFGDGLSTEVYTNTTWFQVFDSGSPGANVYTLAWADADYDNDGYLDLLVGRLNSELVLFSNPLGTGFSPTPIWSSAESYGTPKFDWGDYDGDNYLDLAVADPGGDRLHLYHNNRTNSFSLVAWNPANTVNAADVAWGDYDGDGDLDLAVGHNGGATYIYQNQGGNLSSTPVWSSLPQTANTTSLAWGDWNNDGRLDLAVGNNLGKVQVYANLGGTSEAPALKLLWQSSGNIAATDLAWGDKDRDGDLDLAVSSSQANQSGVFENSYVAPAHLDGVSSFTEYMPLPRHPTYLSVERPGQTDDAYLYSSGEMILSTPTNPTVTINYRLYDPDERLRSSANIDPGRDRVFKTIYEYSLNGGGAWKTASGSPSLTIITPPRQGIARTFAWNAWTNSPINSDNLRFRITIVPQNRVGPVQRAAVSAVSPPFRLRTRQCVWPDDPSIKIVEPQPPYQVDTPLRFLGEVEEGEGLLLFSWDFGDGQTGSGQSLFHTYTTNDTYLVTLTVTGPPCPETNQVVATTVITIGPGGTSGGVYLPIILKSATGTTTAASVPTPVTGLQGSIQPDEGTTRLIWLPNQPTEDVLGYRIYHRSRTATGTPFNLLDTVPANVNSYLDPAYACGQMYYVTAFNAVGESLPSAASYFSPRCW